MSDISIEPVNEFGVVKTSDECFLEAFYKTSGVSPTKQAESLYDLAITSLNGRKFDVNTPYIIKESEARIYENDNVAPHIFVKLLNESHPEWIDWEPETLWTTITATTGQIPSEVVRNKIMAAKSILNSVTFYSEWNVFEKCILALNGIVPNFVVHERPSPGQLAYGVLEALTIKTGEFGHEVKVYVQGVLDDNGYLLMPKELKFAETNTDEDLVDRMKAEWRRIQVESLNISESMEGVQLARLASIAKYIEEKTRSGLGLGVK